MSEIKISIQIDERKNHLHLKDVTEETLKHITKNFFAAAGVELVEDNPRPPLSPPTAKPLNHSIEPVNSRPRKLPLTGATRNLYTPIGEVINGNQDEEDEADPDFYKTGIKERDGVKLYKTRFECVDPECGRKGNHYVPVGTESVLCWDCDKELLVEDAAYNGFPERDVFGNFYIAVKDFDKGEDING